MADIVFTSTAPAEADSSVILLQKILQSMNSLLTAVNGPIIGTGSPEGAETAGVGTFYVDDTADTEGLWFKLTGTGNTGWILFAQRAE
jgi:hypothetical protein